MDKVRDQLIVISEHSKFEMKYVSNDLNRSVYYTIILNLQAVQTFPLVLGEIFKCRYIVSDN